MPHDLLAFVWAVLARQPFSALLGAQLDAL
jgi:hypothetical protein